MPAERAELEIEAVIEAEAFGRIRLGYAPRTEQEKWLLRWEAGNWLSCYRTATGHCIYTARFEADDTAENYTIPEAWANRNPAQYRNQDTPYDARLFIYLVRRLLLGHNVPFPAPTALSHRHKLTHEQHVMGTDDNTPSSVIPLDLL